MMMALFGKICKYLARWHTCVREKRTTKPGFEPGTSPWLAGRVTTTLPSLLVGGIINSNNMFIVHKVSEPNAFEAGWQSTQYDKNDWWRNVSAIRKGYKYLSRQLYNWWIVVCMKYTYYGVCSKNQIPLWFWTNGVSIKLRWSLVIPGQYSGFTVCSQKYLDFSRGDTHVQGLQTLH